MAVMVMEVVAMVAVDSWKRVGRGGESDYNEGGVTGPSKVTSRTQLRRTPLWY